jgi:hypothetical protein
MTAGQLAVAATATTVTSSVLYGTSGNSAVVQTNASGNLLASVMPAYTGDVTSPAGSGVNTLATVNGNVGTFQGLTVNAKGLVTAAANQGYVTGGPYLPTVGGTISGSPGSLVIGTPAGGSLGVGTLNLSGNQRISQNAAVPANLSAASPLTIIQADQTSNNLRLYAFNTGALAPANLALHKRRGTAAASTQKLANDSLGGVYGVGFDGTNDQVCASIAFNAVANTTSASSPGSIVLGTVQPGVAGTITSVMSVQAGVVIGAPAGGDLGAGTLNTSGIQINQNAAQPVVATGGPYALRVIAADSSNSAAVIDAFAGSPSLTIRRANGTGASPTPVIATNPLGSVFFGGWVSATASNNTAAIQAQATETYSGTNQGSSLAFYTTTTGTSTLTSRMQISGTGAVAMQGTVTNDSATAGYIGEYVSSIVASSAVSLTSGTAVNLTSFSLTAGDWDVWSEAWFNAAASTTISELATSITVASGSFPGSPQDGVSTVVLGTYAAGLSRSTAIGVPSAPARVSIGATTTYYLNAVAQFGVSTLTAGGKICARRRR